MPEDVDLRDEDVGEPVLPSRGPKTEMHQFFVYVECPNTRKLVKVYIGMAYNNEHGIWAETDSGTERTYNMDNACQLVVKNMNLNARGLYSP